MITITAVIRARPGRERALRDALMAVASHVAANEPDTLGFFLSQDLEDAAVFTTYERFVDRAAMNAHNGSAAVAAFFAQAGELIDGDVILHACAEFSAKK